MPWNMNDYPASFKNFDPLLRKKMIDIANALLESGHDDDSAIPIAISQAKEWYDDASEKEREEFKDSQNPQKSDDHETDSANPDLYDEDVNVYFEDDQWKVKSVKAQRAADSFKRKKDAIDRAREIAKNKGSQVITYKKDENPSS